METEMIDKLYLELSHVTKAKTHKEIELEKTIECLQRIIVDMSNYEFKCGINYCDDCPFAHIKLACLVPKQRNFSQ